MFSLSRINRLSIRPLLILSCTILMFPNMIRAQDQKFEGTEAFTTMFFKDVTKEVGVDFVHYAPRPRWCEIGPTVRGVSTNEELLQVFHEEKEYWKSSSRLLTPEEFAHIHLIKMNGSGGAWLDFDRDGDWDIYLVNCQGPGVTNALFENLGDGTFRRNECGVEDAGEGMAASVADYNNDGYTDLFVTNYGHFELFRNNGDKTFTNVTQNAFPEAVKDWWYGGSAWGDYDLDGDLDLYVAGYVDFSNRPQETNLRFPMDFVGLPNTLYRNNGDGTFTDVTDQAENVGDARRKSMQPIFFDFNEDGWPDIFVTNDTDPNGLYLNKGNGTFKSFSGPSGLSTTDGSMGVSVGDYDGDGRMDITYANFAAEVNVIAHLEDNESSNDGKVRNAIYVQDFDSPQVLKMSWPRVSWGTGFFDLDNDGDLDLFFASGHLNSVSGDNRQLNLLFENDGKGRFTDVAEAAGVWGTGKRIHRSALFADYDNDGRMDIYVTNNGQQVEDGKGNITADKNQGVGVLYKNESKTNNNWLKVRLEGWTSNRDAYGSRVKLTLGRRSLVRALVSGEGYFSSNAKELHFGLGKADKVDRLEIKWPTGIIQTFANVGSNQTILIVEGKDTYQEQ